MELDCSQKQPVIVITFTNSELDNYGYTGNSTHLSVTTAIWYEHSSEATSFHRTRLDGDRYEGTGFLGSSSSHSVKKSRITILTRDPYHTAHTPPTGWIHIDLIIINALVITLQAFKQVIKLFSYSAYLPGNRPISRSISSHVHILPGLFSPR